MKKECTLCGLLKTTTEATGKLCLNETPHDFGVVLSEQKKCICLEDNKLTQALCSVHGKNATQPSISDVEKCCNLCKRELLNKKTGKYWYECKDADCECHRSAVSDIENSDAKKLLDLTMNLIADNRELFSRPMTMTQATFPEKNAIARQQMERLSDVEKDSAGELQKLLWNAVNDANGKGLDFNSKLNIQYSVIQKFLLSSNRTVLSRVIEMTKDNEFDVDKEDIGSEAIANVAYKDKYESFMYGYNQALSALRAELLKEME